MPTTTIFMDKSFDVLQQIMKSGTPASCKTEGEKVNAAGGRHIQHESGMSIVYA